MVLPELASRVAERFHDIPHAWIKWPETEFGPGQADLGQAGADRRLPGDEGRAACGAALLAVPIGEDRTLPADAINVGRAIAHDSKIVGADIEPADVVTHDEQDVRLTSRWRRCLLLCLCLRDCSNRRERGH